MRSQTSASADDAPMLNSYAQLAAKLVHNLTGICLLDSKMRSRGQTGDMNADAIKQWLQSLDWRERVSRSAAAICLGKQCISAIPLEQSDGTLLGVFCTQEPLVEMPTHLSRHARQLRHALKPLLDCVHRELAVALSVRSRLQSLTEQIGRAHV